MMWALTFALLFRERCTTSALREPARELQCILQHVMTVAYIQKQLQCQDLQGKQIRRSFVFSWFLNVIMGVLWGFIFSQMAN